MGAVISFSEFKSKRIKQPNYSLVDLITNPIKRKEVYNYYDSIYEETEEEKRIFEEISSYRRRNVD